MTATHKLTIEFPEGAYAYRIGYRVKDSGSPYTFVAPDPTESPVVVNGVSPDQYEIILSTVCDGRVSPGITTLTQAINTTIKPFALADILEADRNTFYFSNIITVEGPNIPVPISVINGYYSINGGEFTNVDGYVEHADSVQVRVLSSTTEYDTPVNAALTVSSFTESFIVTTALPVPVSVTFTQAKDEDPHVDIVLIPLVNGVNIGNIYHSRSGTFDGINVGDTVNMVLNHSPASLGWPDGSTGRLRVYGNAALMFDSGNVGDIGETLTSYQFITQPGVDYDIQTSSEGDSTNYKPVEIIQVNDSSAPMSTGHPQVVLFNIVDNTTGLMVFNDGTYTYPQTNGFNYLDNGTSLAAGATLSITNNYTEPIRFLIQNGVGETTYFSNVDVDPGQTVTLAVPKESLKITYDDIADGKGIGFIRNSGQAGIEWTAELNDDGQLLPWAPVNQSYSYTNLYGGVHNFTQPFNVKINLPSGSGTIVHMRYTGDDSVMLSSTNHAFNATGSPVQLAIQCSKKYNHYFRLQL